MSYMNMGAYDKEDFEKLDNIFKTIIPNAKEIWLFGNGRFGRAFEKFFSICGVKINGHVVSDEQYMKGVDCITTEELKQRYIPGKIKVFLTIDSCYYTETIPKLMFLGDDLIYISRVWKENVIDRVGTINDITVIVPVCDHCAGIKCFGCTVGAPLAKSSFYDFEIYKKDLQQLKKIVGLGGVQHINFTGGDIFLHPQFVDFVGFARSMFPKAYLDCSTNGLLLKNQSDDVWRELGKYEISFNWTLYPVRYPDLEDIVERITYLSDGKVRLSIIGDGLDENKNSWIIPYSLYKQEKYDWLFCRFHKDNHQCITVRDGKVAYCYSMRRLRWICEAFGSELTEDFKNAANAVSIDLYKIHSIDELHEWMNSRMDFCDYCAIRERKSMGKWIPSNCEMSEWFV